MNNEHSKNDDDNDNAFEHSTTIMRITNFFPPTPLIILFLFSMVGFYVKKQLNRKQKKTRKIEKTGH